ncbi:MAG TPA: phosphatase PAP2 family protein [Anaerolineales bacterium]|jgi:membrane-associated phospholipid phosphatase|nr:phosphatase PAP2 family protein [Anaerolineales bacterium]HQX15431.1 phosphatase PAP2 family protein [Anaerolineales bacterium]
MGSLIQNGIDWIIAIQALGGWLEAPMQFFTFLGSQDFFFLVLPFIYWSIDAGLGMRVAFGLIASVSLNSYFKLWFVGPRPYWVSGNVQGLSAETSFGVPSGHAQNAMAVWGIIAARIGKRVAWMLAITLAFLIGFSRLYLGVHFVHDVLAGWALGAAVLWGVLRFWDPVAAWLKSKTVTSQISLAFVMSLVMIALGYASAARLDGYIFPEEYRVNALRASDELPAPASLETIVTSAGTFFGLAAGLAWILSRGGYQADGPGGKRALRFFVGLVGVFILWRGLGAILPDGESFIPLVLRYSRYALVGFWISAGAPELFFRFKLADPQI